MKVVNAKLDERQVTMVQNVVEERMIELNQMKNLENQISKRREEINVRKQIDSIYSIDRYSNNYSNDVQAYLLVKNKK